MGKNLEPKCKQCRRVGEKLFLKGERCVSTKCAMIKRNYPPGFHGQKGRGKMTDYGTQLNEKQKIRKQYVMMEKQFRLTFEKAKKKVGNTGENFLKLLETRLDNVVFRLGFAVSRSQARQMVGHGLFTVNGNKVDIPSYTVNTGDIIRIKTNKKNTAPFREIKERLKKVEVPGWLNLETKEEIAGKVLHEPQTEELMKKFNVHVVVEYYSR